MKRRAQSLQASAASVAKRAEKAAHDARAASAAGDVTVVNGQVERDRVRRSLGVMALLLLLSGCGCSLLDPVRPPPPPADLPPAVVVIPSDRYQYPMTNSLGVSGWFVPLAVHAEMMEAVALVDYYRQQSRSAK
jgi:hypothetical protein